MTATFPDYSLQIGDCRELLASFPDNCIDSCVTDPPYELGFMGKGWDKSGIANDPALWREVLRVLKPGGHLLAFSGTRTYHHMACAIEDAGFEIRDQLGWMYGSGFPKSQDVSKAIDKAAGVEREVLSQGTPVKRMIPGADQNKTGWVKDNGREFVPTVTVPATAEAEQWAGWGTALKPAWEPICMARKPLAEKTVAANVLKHGTGAINIDGCRVNAGGDKLGGGMVSMGRPKASEGWDRPWMHDPEVTDRKKGESADKVAIAERLGRFPANLIHDGSEEVLALFPDSKGQLAKASTSDTQRAGQNTYGVMRRGSNGQEPREDSGSAARFFYCAKANKKDRDAGGAGNKHPTVKPTDLMRYLCRLVTPKGGVVLDPFAGSGSTGRGALLEGFQFAGMEQDASYAEIAETRLRDAYAEAGRDLL